MRLARRIFIDAIMYYYTAGKGGALGVLVMNMKAEPLSDKVCPWRTDGGLTEERNANCQ